MAVLDPDASHQPLILAALLSYPEEDALGALRDLLPEAPWLAAPIAELGRLTLGQWQGEHTRLFVTGYPGTPCPPFESAYRQGMMGGTAVGELVDLYRRAGLEARGAAADYLGTQLECLVLIGERADPAGQELARELWDDHLRHWLPRFAGDLQVHGELQLYRVLGERLARLRGPTSAWEAQVAGPGRQRNGAGTETETGTGTGSESRTGTGTEGSPSREGVGS